MSESVKPRIAVDLSEIERQLAPARAASSAGPSTRNDPLAELARIVGQEDPFQSMLGQGQRGRYPQAVQYPHAVQDHGIRDHGVDDHGADDHGVRDLDDLYRSAGLPAQGAPAPALRAGAAPQARGYALDGYGAAEDVHEPAAYADPAHAAYDEQGHYDEGYYPAGEDHGQAYAEERDMRSLEPRRSRKGLLVGCAVAALVVIGGGAWYAAGPSAMLAGGPPPVIKASVEPTKVHPENPGGVEIPNQNKQIYERAKQSTETKVVNREEQPIDVKEAARIAAAGTVTGTTGATGATGATGGPATSLNLGEPKKVRTVSIRPDGTVVTPDSAPAALPPPPPARQAAMMPPPPMTMPTGAQPAPPTIQTAASTPRPAGTTSSTPASPAAQKPVASAATPASATPQRVASLQPVAPAESASEAPLSGYSVQLGVRGSEGDAQKAFTQMQSKYADLQGQPALIRKAEVNGATVYRVRVGPMSKDDASTLCSRLQGGGAQCFVSKN
ncbi:MAG: SPOR domain-containing protein [Microvirga sp.]